MGFFQQLTAAYGQNVAQQEQQDLIHANIEEKQQQVAQQKMQTMQMQQTMKTQKQVGDAIAIDQKRDADSIADPERTAKEYDKYSSLFLSGGNFDGAKRMSEMASGKRKEIATALEQVIEKKAAANETMASAAQSYMDNPSPENLAAFDRASVGAGQNPLTMARPGEPAFDDRVRNAGHAGQTSKQRGDERLKVAELAETRRVAAEVHRDGEKDKALQRQATAAYQNASLGMQREAAADRKERYAAEKAAAEEKPPTIKEFDTGAYTFDPKNKLPGERYGGDPRWARTGDLKMTAQQKTGVSKLNSSSAEVGRSLTAMTSLDVSTKSSGFGNLGAKSPMDAFIKIGANTLTPVQSQILTVAGANMGNQIGLAESAFGGRGPVGSQQTHLEEITTPNRGDTGLTAAYKMANAKELMVTLLDSAPPAYRNSEDAKKRKAEFEKAIPWSTQDIIAEAKKNPNAKEALGTLHELGARTMTAKGEMQERVEKAKTAGSVGPSGDAVPAHIQALLDKY